MSTRKSTARDDYLNPAPPPVERRALKLATYADARDEITRLRSADYQRLGQWDLAQICFHLNYYYHGSLEGFGFKTPWLLRVTLGRWHFNSWSKSGKIKAGMMTIPASRPMTHVDDTSNVDYTPEVDTALTLLSRLETQPELHPSPLFGKLDADQWRMMHLLHTAHHLAFLNP